MSSQRALNIQIVADQRGALHLRAQGNLSLQEILLALEMMKDDIIKKAKGAGAFDLETALQPRKMP